MPHSIPSKAFKQGWVFLRYVLMKIKSKLIEKKARGVIKIGKKYYIIVNTTG